MASAHATERPGRAAGAPIAHVAQVDGQRVYCELWGAGGPPLVLLPGGMHTIDTTFGSLLPGLAARHRLVAIELQGHGHTPDSDRPLSLARLADDVAEVVTLAGVDRADVLGFSLGGLVSVELARRHPCLVHRLILASAPTRAAGTGRYRGPSGRAGGEDGGPTASELDELRAAYRAVAPDPNHFEAFETKAGAMVESLSGWSTDQLHEISAKVLILVGDRDLVSVEDAAATRSLLPDAELAVIPGADHHRLLRHEEVVTPILERFLLPWCSDD